MNFFGLGIPELILIVVLTLLVIGPERLPDAARQIAKLIARARKMFLGSPEAVQMTQMALQLRSEIDSELAELRRSLAEIQASRAEFLKSTNQWQQSIGQGLNDVEQELMQSLPTSPMPVSEFEAAQTRIQAREDRLHGLPDYDYAATVEPVLPNPDPAPELAPSTELPEPAASNPHPELPGNPPQHTIARGMRPKTSRTELISAEDLPSAIAPPAAENGEIASVTSDATQINQAAYLPDAEISQVSLEQLGLRLQSIMQEVWQLQQELQRRGIIESSWEPPTVKRNGVS